MKKVQPQNLLLPILAIYAACFLFRAAEYLFIRTDHSFIGEAFIHKLVGILILFAALKHFSLRPAETGFGTQHILKNTLINTLHLSTPAGTDELQTMRITLAQTISFLAVLYIFLKGKFYRKSTFR